MGNIFESESTTTVAVDNFESFLTFQENSILKTAYDDIFSGSVSKISVIKYFDSMNYPEFAENLIHRGVFVSFRSFQKFVIESSRLSHSKSLESMWLSINPQSDSLRDCEIARIFFILVFDMAFNNEISLNSFGSSLSRLLKFVKSHPQRLANIRDTTSLADINSIPLSLDDLIQWSNDYAPHLSKLIESYFNVTFFGNVKSPTFVRFKRPTFNEEGSSISLDSDILPLSFFNDKLRGSFKKLYTTEKDGRSFNRITHHLLGYDGPTLILIKVLNSNAIIGAYAADRWKEHNRFFGSSNDFLFTLAPDFNIYRSVTNSNTSYRWLNSKTYGHKHGLGFGGSSQSQFRLFIPDSLENCIANSNCLTFESGKLVERNEGSGNYVFEIDIMEVWGCGGDDIVVDAAKAQEKFRAIKDDNINRARKCDKAAFFGNSFDQEFLLGNTMQHRNGMENR